MNASIRSAFDKPRSNALTQGETSPASGSRVEKIDILLKHESRVLFYNGISFVGTDVASDRAVVIAVIRSGKTPLVGWVKARRCIVPAAARVTRIDRRTAGDQRMGLGRTAVFVRGARICTSGYTGPAVGRARCEAGDTRVAIRPNKLKWFAYDRSSFPTSVSHPLVSGDHAVGEGEGSDLYKESSYTQVRYTDAMIRRVA